MGNNSSLAIVTGAAKGIGRACVDGFVANGWQVAALDRDEAVRATFASAEAVTPLVVDITDPVTLRAELARLPSPVMALVNAAGVFPPTSLATFNVEMYRRIFDVNVLGTLLTSQPVSREMPEGGVIIKQQLPRFTPVPGPSRKPTGSRSYISIGPLPRSSPHQWLHSTMPLPYRASVVRKRR